MRSHFPGNRQCHVAQETPVSARHTAAGESDDIKHSDKASHRLQVQAWMDKMKDFFAD